MTYANRIDSNQPEVVQALRDIGASVTLLNSVKDGCPDLLVGFRGQNFLFEVKDGRKPPSDRRLTKAEQKWFDDWRGTAFIVYSGADAVSLLEKLTMASDGIPF